MVLNLTDPTSASILGAAVGADLEVFGPQGQLLGRFTPAPRPGMNYPELGLSDEELDLRENDPNAVWFSPDDVMSRLKSLRRTA